MTTNAPVVMAVDDEPGILRLISLELSMQGFKVLTASGSEEALKTAEEQRPDIALLDVVMPEMTGLELMRRLRERSPIPVILLTAKGAEADKVRGLELGADDYIAKPFSPDELSARVRAVLRRTGGGPGSETIVKAGSVEIDLNRRLVHRDGHVVSLTRTEWMLLQHMASHPGKVMLNSELLGSVWGPEYRGDLQYLRVWISRLRRKLEEDPSNPKLIRTFQGVGYMFVSDDHRAKSEESSEDEAGDDDLVD